MARLSHRITPLVVALALGLGVPRTASAQYRIDTWTTEQGLPQNAVTDILQTRDGFLWLSTFGGLVRFDGASMHVFTTVNAPGMRTSRLTDGMIEATDGALWINTETHGVVRYYQGVFSTFTEADGLPEARLRSFFLEDGQFIVDTPGGMVRWDGVRFARHTSARPAGDDPRRTILSFLPDGGVWYHDADGLHRFDHGRVTRTLPGLNPRRVYEDRAGRIWMESQDRHLQCLTRAGLVTYGEQDGIPRFATASMSEDREGNVWFGLRLGGGLLRFDGMRFTRYTTADGLPSDNVGRVFEDREGTRWVPTEGGLARITQRVFTTYSKADGLEADNTYPIFQDRRGDVYVGGWQGLTRYRDGVFTSVAKEFGVAGENVMAMAEDRDGALWIGLWGDGVLRVKDGKVTAFAGAASPGVVVRAILQGRGPDLWFGGESGLSRFRDGTFTRFAAASGYAGGAVHALFEDRGGTVWIGTESGLVRYRDGVFTAFGEKAGLAGGPVRAVHEDRDGTLWLGTYDSGLFRFRDGRFTRYTTREGLFANGAFRIIEDAQDRFWITSNSGIYRVARRDLDALASGRVTEVTSVPYGRRDGMLNAECNGGGQPAGIRARDGRIWFPTQRGVAVFDPEKVPVETTPPPVILTALFVADQPVPLGDRVEIRAGPRSFEVQFTALTFIRPELTRFRYRIEGLDSRWVDAGGARAARVAQLPYGTYTFRVIAANRDGAWNSQGAAVRLVVVPPYWRTPWFAALVFGGVAAVAVGVHRARIAGVRRQEALRAAFSRQLIDSQESDRRRIAAGLHDGLSQNLIVIRNWALLGQRGLPPEHAARERLGEIESAAALALGEVRDVVHDLAPHNLERLGLAQTITEMVDRVAGASGIRFMCRTTEVNGTLPKPVQMNVYRIVQEAVNNVVKHSGAGRAWVELHADAGLLRVAVRDDGRGFDGGVRPEPGSGGFGLFGMAERLRMIGGRLSIDSAPGRGTSVTIELPIEPAS